MWPFGKKEKEERVIPLMPDEEHVQIPKTPVSLINPQDHLRPESLQGMNEDRLAKDLEMLNSKLDLINARLENLNHRIANIERLAYEEEKRRW
ncbi:MAG: hypothetical protein AABW87_01235 [Nanoarchaeota archaeon]